MMARMKAYLAQVPAFRSISRTTLRRLADACELHRFSKGQVVFEEGQLAHDVWVVKQGWVSLVKRTPSGGLATIFVMTPDEVLCGISAFDRGTYSSGAVCATDSQLIRLPAHVFGELLDQDPQLAKATLLSCCQRIRHMADAISLAQAPVQQRIAHTLLRLQATFGPTIPLTHQELARMAGTRWETSIRTLAGMKRRGWLTSTRGRITLLQPRQLKNLAQSANPSYNTNSTKSGLASGGRA